MAQMIPDFIDQDDHKRNGERMVFKWLSDDSIPGTAFYSLLQKNHKHKMIAEVDFLYISQKGILCIEVKGGQEIYCKDKQWYSLSRTNVENKISNPFIQAKDCMYALKSYLEQIYGKKSPQTNYLIGYAVIFPECRFTGHGNDLVTEVMFDAGYELNEFPSFLNSTLEYWSQMEIIKHNYRPSHLTKEQFNQIIDLLRGDFCVVPSMNLEIQHVNKQMLRLTEEQFEALDITEDNKKVIIQGVAGTGKSLLALEKARKTAAKGKSVLYLCFNKNMSKYADNSIEVADNTKITISTYHAFIQQHLKNEIIYDKDIEIISKIFIENKPQVEKYDCLVIDEAQDLMSISVIEVFENLLTGGLANSEWVMFLDPNQNIFNNSLEYNFALEYLKEAFSPTLFTLNKNCRNTEQIGRKITVLTLVPSAKHMKITGPKVIIKSYKNETDLLKKLKKEINSLLSGGVSSKDIVLLSKYKLDNSNIKNQKSMCKLDINEVYDISNLGRKSLNFFTVQSFKGLESNIVFYIDVDGFEKDSDRMLNYVAMSRAKILLYIFYKDEIEEEYDKITEQGRELLY
jgi:superfamily I DNA/RNA helicase